MPTKRRLQERYKQRSHLIITTSSLKRRSGRSTALLILIKIQGMMGGTVPRHQTLNLSLAAGGVAESLPTRPLPPGTCIRPVKKPRE
jgi:hypothetical protein